MSFNIDEKFFTVKEISELLKLSELTIYKYIKENRLEAIEFGGHFRISEASLQAFLSNHKSNQGGTEE